MSTNTFVLERSTVEKKRISVSEKRQITIPKKFYEELNFGDEVEIMMQDGGLFIRPISEWGDDFSENIIADLIEEGYEGQELLKEFSKRKAALRFATRRLIQDAKEAVENFDGVDRTDEIFGEE